ncbi:MAG: type II toxin-antitoxin system VapC family toxin [Anaerolineales bacterium]|nr:type II toxin-antitoxin system VapC family toxin [Chloroflexota bacterium]MBL6983312.1 type II toxin-antitoxin system VapC family toxin [Anaerolineales bacterium]
MSNYLVVDASLWVARLIAQDAFHELSRQWLDAQRAQGVQFVSPTLLLVEVAAAISRRTGNSELAKKAVEALQALPDLRLVEMDQSVVQAAVDAGADLGVRGADAVYIAVAQQLSLPLATLDNDQRERASRVVEIWEFSE